MKLPRTQEYQEAEQAKADESRQALLKIYDEEEKKKMAAIEDAVKILTDAGIRFHLFPELPRMDAEGDKEDTVWQWNSLAAFTEYDELGRTTEASFNRNNKYWANLTKMFIYNLNYCSHGDYNINQERMNEMFDFICKCLNDERRSFSLNK